jgi:hypothetical protein
MPSIAVWPPLTLPFCSSRPRLCLDVITSVDSQTVMPPQPSLKRPKEKKPPKTAAEIRQEEWDQFVIESVRGLAVTVLRWTGQVSCWLVDPAYPVFVVAAFQVTGPHSACTGDPRACTSPGIAVQLGSPPRGTDNLAYPGAKHCPFDRGGNKEGQTGC